MNFTSTQTTNNNTQANKMPSANYASSVCSDSSDYSVAAEKMNQHSCSSSSHSKRSLGKKVKSVLSSLGEHPTDRYNRKHGAQESKKYFTAPLPVSRL